MAYTRIPGPSGTAAGDLKMVGYDIYTDADSNTRFELGTDNEIQVFLNAAKDFTFSANTLTAETGSTITTPTLTATTSLTSPILQASSATKVTLSTNSKLKFENAAGTNGAFLNATGDGLVTLQLLDGSTSGTLTVGTLTATNVGGTLTTAAQGNVTSLGTLTILNADNLRLDGNTLSSTDANGAINLTPNGSGAVVVPNTFTVGASLPFSDSAGTLTLQNVDALDATTESTIEAAIDTLANLTSVQGQTITLSGSLTVSGASTINQSVATTASPTFVSATLTKPTVQTFTTGSGTYTLPANVKWIRVRAVGGGGGGGGSGTGSHGTGGAGGNTTFGTTLIEANGGGGGNTSTNAATGGTASKGAAIGFAAQGAFGGSNGGGLADGGYFGGGHGGSTPFGAGGKGATNAAGVDAVANSGGGGGGGGSNNVASAYSGTGGAAGGYVDAIIPTPAASYSYAVGAAGTAGAAGTSGFAGGVGGSGFIIVEEFYA